MLASAYGSKILPLDAMALMGWNRPLPTTIMEKICTPLPAMYIMNPVIPIACTCDMANWYAFCWRAAEVSAPPGATTPPLGASAAPLRGGIDVLLAYEMIGGVRSRFG